MADEVLDRGELAHDIADVYDRRIGLQKYLRCERNPTISDTENVVRFVLCL